MLTTVHLPSQLRSASVHLRFTLRVYRRYLKISLDNTDIELTVERLLLPGQGQ